MAHPSEDTTNPQPSVSTQESGAAGLSSDLKHEATTDYSSSPEPKGSSGVKPILHEDQDLFDKDGPRPSGPGLVPSGRFALNPPHGQNKKPPPQPGSFSTGRGKKEEAVEASPGTTAISGTKMAGVDGHTKGHEERDDKKGGGKAEEPAKKRRRHQKGSDGKIMKGVLIVMLALTVPICTGLPAGKCFSCMDRDRCPKIQSIFDGDISTLYEKGSGTFPSCSGVQAPPSKCCDVCNNQTSILILCSEDVDVIQAEDDQDKIENIIPCKKQLTKVPPPMEDPALNSAGCNHCIGTVAFLLLLVVCAALVI